MGTELIQNSSGQESANTSGQGSAFPAPEEIQKWNWGAFILNWIWGIGNQVWISLLTLIPILGLVMTFVLGAKGNEWAWQARRWESIEHFKRTQRKWTIGALIYCGVTLGLVLLFIVVLVRVPDDDDPANFQTISGLDGQISIRIPPSWSVDEEVAGDAEIGAFNRFEELFAWVEAQPKQDLGMDLAAFAADRQAALTAGLDSPRVLSGPTELTINGNRALRFQIQDAEDISLFTVIESPTFFLQALAWTPSSLFPDHEATLIRVSGTVKAS